MFNKTLMFILVTTSLNMEFATAHECGLVRSSSSPMHIEIVQKANPIVIAQPQPAENNVDQIGSEQPKSVPELTALLSSRDVEVRREAASTLSDIGTAAVIKPLSEIALDDTDHAVQRHALAGLRRATGVGGDTEDESTEHQYIDFWQRWASFKDQSGSPLSVPLLEPNLRALNVTYQLSHAGTDEFSKYVKRSDLIVIGGLTPEHKATGRTGHYYLVSVKRILKNSEHRKLKHVVARLDYGSPLDCGIFFLKRKPDGTYVNAADWLYPDVLPSAPGKPAKTKQPPDPIVAVIDELVRVLATPAGKIVPAKKLTVTGNSTAASAISPPMTGVPMGLPLEKKLVPSSPAPPESKICTSPTVAMYAAAAGGLKELPHQKVLSSLRPILKSSQLEDQSKLWVVNVLYSLGDSDSLNVVTPILLSPGSHSEGTDCALHTLANALEDAVCVELAEPVKMVPDVSTMSMLLHSPHVDLRRAASYVLARKGGKDIIEPLANVGLYDPDLEVRSNSIWGLADATGIAKNCNESEFATNQADYVDFWRRWAHAMILTKTGDALVIFPPIDREQSDIRLNVRDTE